MLFSSTKTNTDEEQQPSTPHKDVDPGILVSESTANVRDLNRSIVNHAIEAIGMGRYQWKLTVSCGFGFVVDQVRKTSIDYLVLTLLTTCTDVAAIHKHGHATSVQGILATVCNVTIRCAVCRSARWGNSIRVPGRHYGSSLGLAIIYLWCGGIHYDLRELAELGCVECFCRYLWLVRGWEPCALKFPSH